MAYKMLSPEDAKHPYSPSAYVLTIIASVCGLWAIVFDFQEFNEAI